MSIDYKSLYKEKNEYLGQYFEEVSPLEFYRELFPVGSLEREGVLSDEKPNGLALVVREKGKGIHKMVFDDLEAIEELQKEDFVIMSPISYFGNRRTGKNASFLHAFCFDLDGVDNMKNLESLCHYINIEAIIPPTYLVNSGRGIHLYYFLALPSPMYPKNQKALKALKFALTEKIWNKYTSERKDIEMQGIMQGFRMVGSPSKLGKEFPVRAFRVGDKTTVGQLLYMVPEANKQLEKIVSLLENNSVPLAIAKERWPEWYQRRIVEGQPRGSWTVNRALYDWWKRRLKEEILIGHRYFGMMTLAIYAQKCGIEREELERDAFEIMEELDRLSVSEENRFTKEDVFAALEAYNENFNTFPRETIEKITGLKIPKNEKRKNQKRVWHLEDIRDKKRKMKARGEPFKNPEGRPKGSGTAEAKVKAFRTANPEGTKSQCQKETGLSFPTIRKWWN